MSDGGKGSAPRKQQDHKSYETHYEQVFGNNSWLARKKLKEQIEADKAASMRATLDELDRMSIYDTPSERNSRKD